MGGILRGSDRARNHKEIERIYSFEFGTGGRTRTDYIYRRGVDRSRRERTDPKLFLGNKKIPWG
uniref:Uncharacterized protein n=1 Tax=Aegilops tauschii subsp. strangulata TaxID=200361 RepID=A0A452YKY8_AEGTS